MQGLCSNSAHLWAPERAGVMQPQRASILKNAMVQPGWGATGKVPLYTNTTHIS